MTVERTSPTRINIAQWERHHTSDRIGIENSIDIRMHFL